MHIRSILMGAAASALVASAAFAERGSDGQVNILYWQAVSIMNPYLSNGTKDVEAGSLVLEPLARFNENGDMVPYLAQEIPTLENGGVSEDLTTITWKLKDGLLWSDSTPVTAEDAIFSWQYCTHPEGDPAEGAIRRLPRRQRSDLHRGEHQADRDRALRRHRLQGERRGAARCQPELPGPGEAPVRQRRAEGRRRPGVGGALGARDRRVRLCLEPAGRA